MDISDNNIINMFFSRSERAISALSEKYGRLCLAISDNLLNSREDAEECTNDAYLKVWNTIPPEKPDSLRAYLCRIVRNTALDKLKYRTRKKRSGNTDALLSELDECIPAPDSTELAADDTAAKSVADFLKTQSRQSQVLFIRRYFYCESTASLAKRFGISESNVTTTLCRMRKKLRTQLEKDGICV